MSNSLTEGYYVLHRECCCVLKVKQQILLKLQKHHNLMIYFYDDKQVQFPIYSTENTQSHSLWIKFIDSVHSE